MTIADFAQIAVARVATVLAQLPSAESTWLSVSEQARLARLKVVERRQHYLAGHWLLRQHLAQHCAAQPEAWQLIERENLPPAIADSALQCALSHSREWVACAISYGAIGIDLETRRARPGLRRFASLLRAVDDTPELADEDVLLQRWVLKEALIKRDHGSALPEQLAAIQLIRSQHEDPSRTGAKLLSTQAFHLAIASARPYQCTLELPITQRQFWRVRRESP